MRTAADHLAAARTARIVRALSVVRTFGVRTETRMTDGTHAWAAHLLWQAGGDMMRGVPAALALREASMASAAPNAATHEALASDVIEALCGSFAAFENTHHAQKINVLRYAMCILGQWADWRECIGPESYVVRSVESTLGEDAWNEVAALHRAHSAARAA